MIKISGAHYRIEPRPAVQSFDEDGNARLAEQKPLVLRLNTDGSGRWMPVDDPVTRRMVLDALTPPEPKTKPMSQKQQSRFDLLADVLRSGIDAGWARLLPDGRIESDRSRSDVADLMVRRDKKTMAMANPMQAVREIPGEFDLVIWPRNK